MDSEKFQSWLIVWLEHSMGTDLIIHDIGKNLVRIILESNGYAVVDLGIRIDSSQLIRAIREHNPDAVGLSGLLVKSSRYMVNVAEHLKEENIDIPVLVGGQL